MTWSLGSSVILATIVIIGIFVVWKMSRELRSGFPLQDERTKAITGRSATFAFYIGSYFMIALMLGNILSLEFRGRQLMDTGYALVAAILVQSLIFIVVNSYFKMKED